MKGMLLTRVEGKRGGFNESKGSSTTICLDGRRYTKNCICVKADKFYRGKYVLSEEQTILVEKKGEYIFKGDFEDLSYLFELGKQKIKDIVKSKGIRVIIKNGNAYIFKDLYCDKYGTLIYSETDSIEYDKLIKYKGCTIEVFNDFIITSSSKYADEDCHSIVNYSRQLLNEVDFSLKIRKFSIPKLLKGLKKDKAIYYR